MKGCKCPNCGGCTLFEVGAYYRCSECGKEYVRIVHPNFTEWFEVNSEHER